MRYFLGLDVSAKGKLAIEQWRAQCLPPLERPVPIANFHLTLVFLGHLEGLKLESLINQLDNIEHKKCHIVLDQVGYWSKPSVLFLASATPEGELLALADRLKKLVINTGIEIQHKKYIPHLTIARKVKPPVPCAIKDPSFALSFDSFHLFESVSSKKGVHYPIRSSWKLGK